MNRLDDHHDDTERIGRDGLDDLLREWHDQSSQGALRAETNRPRVTTATTTMPAPARPVPSTGPSVGGRIWSFACHPAVRAAASLVILALVATWLLPRSGTRAMAESILVPNAGRLDARDDDGNLVGPCALEHTDVDVSVSGPFARVTVRQRYHNPYEQKIEAVYTFPLSHHGAVDRMTMTIGDRVVVAEVHERSAARRIYEAARAQGYVASLLEQERPNIFTQSVANIEPGVNIVIEISYVELVPVVEGEYRLHFPMTVAPRYIPGYPVAGGARDAGVLPPGLTLRHGVNLLGPARVVGIDETAAPLGAPTRELRVTDETLISVLRQARPVRFDRSRPDMRSGPTGPLRYAFEVEYADGARERGRILATGVGELNGRWFVIDTTPDPAGNGFSANTTQVPDASRITPMPVPPDMRAGHDISMNVTIDTGGPAITGYRSELHRLRERGAADGGAPAHVLRVSLLNETEIPNRDFRLRWSVDESRIQEAIFVHRPAATEGDSDPHGYLTMMLRPPARVDDADVRPRELVFVLDSSGSMDGFPIEKAQAVMHRAIESMRPQDVFNVITFNNETDVLWTAPRPATDENRAIAIERIRARQGGGGTEMVPAVTAALQARGPHAAPITPEDLANLPADGRTVEVRCPRDAIESGDGPVGELRVRDDLRLTVSLPTAPINLPGSLSPAELVLHPPGPMVRLRGAWVTREGRRVLDVQAYENDDAARPLRCVFFLSDGEVGNDRAVVDTVRDLGSGARVFTVGIGSGPNRSLLDDMAKAGRGASDYITLEGDANAVVETFVRRISTPVLTDVELVFDGIEITDVLSPDGADLYDDRPLLAHGRYTTPGRGTLTVRGVTGAGAYERKIELELPAVAPDHDVIATHWARAKVDEHMARNERDAVIALGKTHGLLTPYTSFVAVERSRITVGGQPMLVTVPIEMPEGQSWEGTFGECRRAQLAALDGADDAIVRRTAQLLSRRYGESVSGGASGVRFYKLHHTDPFKVAAKLNTLLGDGHGVGRVRSTTPSAGGGVTEALAGLYDIRVTANGLRVCVQSEESAEFLENFIEEIDQPVIDRPDAGQVFSFSAEMPWDSPADMTAADQGPQGVPGSTYYTPDLIDDDSTISFPWTRGGRVDDAEATVGLVFDSFAQTTVVGQPSGVHDATETFRAGADLDMYFAVSEPNADVAGAPATGGATFGVPAPTAGVELRSLPSELSNMAYNVAPLPPEERRKWTAAGYALADTHGSTVTPELWKLGEELAAAEATEQTPAAGREFEMIRRETEISVRLERARKFKAASRDREALVVIDEILFLDEDNRDALALQKALRPTARYKFAAIETDEIQYDLIMEGLGSATVAEMSSGTFRSTLEAIAQRSSIDVHVNWSALEAIGVTANDPIVIGDAASVGVVLERLMAEIGDGSSKPRCLIVQGGLLITTEAALQERIDAQRAFGFARLLVSATPDGPTVDSVDVLLVLLGRLVGAGLDEEARTMADTLIAAHPDDARIVELATARGDTWDQTTRDRIAAIARAARERIDAQITTWDDRDRLRRVLHESLWPYVLDDPPDEPRSVRVSVLVTDTKQGTIHTVESAGMDVHGRSRSHPIVVGVIDVARLCELARVDGVRRVEPLHGSQVGD